MNVRAGKTSPEISLKASARQAARRNEASAGWTAECLSGEPNLIGNFFFKLLNVCGVDSGQTQSKKTHERWPVIDQKSGVFVRQIVDQLNDENCEHHHWIEQRPPALRTIGISKRQNPFRTKHLEIYRRPEGLKLAA
jgi:hypothetical protein